MKQIFAGFALCAIVTAPTAAREREPRPFADPSAVVAAELAFARLAQEKGQWTAFRETATKDAVMFVPQPVAAQAWLKRQANPAQAVRWQPHEVWSSCDGSYAVTRGAWQGAAGSGYFTAVWQRQRSGRHRWVLDQGDSLAAPLPVPEMIAAKVAECRPAPPAVIVPGAPTDRRRGASDDGTLRWTTTLAADCSRMTRVALWDGTRFAQVLESLVAAPPPAQRPAAGCG